ncbi:uncharacterized protein LOC111947165 [Oryzias latipes]|uniref:uncharacterized protein LOC111947165 n=1 Tax=Oryzias latipes TaxID=8090 RepID=UPI000CE1F7E0|nr:uncharacterized protein LOC111947165 [Oryzias latipes]
MNFDGYLEPNISEKVGLVVAHSVTAVKEGASVARVLNPMGNTVELKRGLHLGELYALTPTEVGPFLTVPEINGIQAQPNMSFTLEDSPITEEQRAKLSALLGRFCSLFCSSGKDLGRCMLVKHHIRTGDHPPIKQRAYRAAPNKQAEIERQVSNLLADGLVEESCSPWASPVVLVKKKGGQWRFCIDYRRLNSVTIKDSHPLPRVDDSLDALSGSMWFSTLDFSNVYWQVEVAEEDRGKTACTTGRGLYQWRAMPMGLSNSPATFQRMMELVLRGLPWHICLVYLDDILIYSRSFEDHMHHLEVVLTRIKDAGLKLNSQKCHFARDNVVFLGHVVSREGLEPDPRNTDKVKSWPTPRTPSEVRAFVGLCSYLFIYLFIRLEVEGLERVVAYASQALTHTQKRWATFDRELWAIVWAVPEQELLLPSLSVDDAELQQLQREEADISVVVTWLDQGSEQRVQIVVPSVIVPDLLERLHGGPAAAHFSAERTAQTVARCLFEDYVLVHGIPEVLHSDQGRQFEAEVIKFLCQWMGTKKTRTTAYHPKSDGMVERHKRTVIDQLAKMLLSHGGILEVLFSQERRDSLKEMLRTLYQRTIQWRFPGIPAVDGG